ncbi:MAG: RluA family pseudouridine synthase, partial [Alphaproteobacteria bacterium]
MLGFSLTAMAEHAERRHVMRAESAGVRVDKLLAEAFPDLSRTRIKGLIQAGRLVAGGATITDPSYPVKPGQRFVLSVPEPAPALPRAQPIPLNVVYEDAHLIVVDKPPGMVVHPAPGHPHGTLVNALLAHCGDRLSGVGSGRRPGIVHRLDKGTSGLLVAAKTDAAHHGLAGQFPARALSRGYKAVVWGVPSPLGGTIAGNIGRHPRDRKKMAVLAKGGKPALTRYRVVRAFGGVASLVECRLQTGRTHQVRVHLAARGHPVVGDPLYGGRRRRRLKDLEPEIREGVAAFRRQALHAYLLAFRHP